MRDGMVGVVERPSDFEGLRDAWDELLRASGSDGLFLTWEWLFPWWKHLGRRGRLSILTAHADGDLVAIAPLGVAPPSARRLLPFRRVQFLGTGTSGSDYLDLIVRRGWEPEATRAIAERLARGKHMLTLDRIPRRNGLAGELASRLRDRGWSVTEADAGICPFVDLSAHSWDSYLDGCGREHRYAFRRKLRALSRQFDVRWERVESEERRGEALAQLFRLHSARWSPRGGSDALHSSSLRGFHDEVSRLALERGWLRLFLLRLDGKPAAGVYGFLYGGRFYFYQSGFDPAYARWSVGLVAQGLSIRSALEDGALEYDFLHGDEAYKFHWARDVRELRRLDMFAPRGRGLVQREIVALSRSARGLARRALSALSPRGATEPRPAPARGVHGPSSG